MLLDLHNPVKPSSPSPFPSLRWGEGGMRGQNLRREFPDSWSENPEEGSKKIIVLPGILVLVSIRIS